MNAAFLSALRSLYERALSSYGNFKIKNKLLILIFFIVFIVCSVSLFALQVALFIYDDILYNEAAQVLNLSTSGIENELKRIELLSYNIISDSKIQEHVKAIKDNKSGYETSNEISQMINKLLVYGAAERNVSSVTFIDTRKNQYVASSDGNAASIRLTEKQLDHIISSAEEQEGANVIFDPIVNERYLIYTRQIRLIRGLSLENLGTLVVYVNIQRLVQQYLTEFPKDNTKIFILSRNMAIFKSNEVLEKGGLPFQFEGRSGYGIRNIKGDKYFVAHSESEYTGWTYINLIQYDRIFKNVILMRNILLILFFMIFLLSFLISVRLSKNLSKPLENLMQRMKRVENGDFGLQEEDSISNMREDEIGYLQKDFDIMIRKIDTLIKEDFIKQIVIKDAQLRALQAQINPHFLYNTLESINWLAKMNKQTSISLMVEALGNLLRSAVSREDRLITLGDEINLLESYITIQKIRFEERLDFKIYIDEEHKRFMIPKLTLQPIVENSIKYGLECMAEECRVRVTSEVDEDFLRISVEDNGLGIDDKISERLMNGESKTKGTGIGLKNIDDRIKMIFGDRYGVNMERGIEKGTKVSICIPCEG